MSGIAPVHPALPRTRTLLYAAISGKPNSNTGMTERFPHDVPLPRLSAAFAVAWLLVLVVVVWRLPSAGLSAARLAGSAACLALLASSYSWLTIRHPPAHANFTADTSVVRPELAALIALAVMAACVFVITFLVPGLEM